MLNNKQYNRFILLMGILISFQVSMSQDRSGEIEDTQVIIEKDKPLSLPKANRHYQPTEIDLVKYESSAINYDFSEVTYSAQNYNPSFDYRTFNSVNQQQLYNNYIKAGYGNFGSPLIEGQYLLSYDDHYLKTFVKHLSFSKGPVREEESAFSQNQVRLQGHLDGDISFDPYISWSREGFYFYGRDNEDDLLNPFVIDDKIILQTVETGVGIDLNLEEVGMDLNPFFRSTINKISGGEKFNAESLLSLNGRGYWQALDKLKIGLGMRLDNLRYESQVLQKRTYFDINPLLTFSDLDLSIKGGLKLAFANDSTGSGASTYFYPDVEVILNLIDGVTLYGNIDGGLQLTSLYDLSNENRYLENVLPFLNQNRKLGIGGGVRTKITDQFFLDASLGYDLIEDMPFFIHSGTDSSRFTVAYDSGSISRTKLMIGAGYFSGNVFSLNYNLTYYGYAMNSLEAPWYKPNAEMNLLANYNLNDRFNFQFSTQLLTGITAPRAFDGSAQKLPAILDIGIGVEVKLIEKASVFADVRNLISKEYERYLYYPTRGISFKLGFIYRF